jgi:peptide/nickel transport system substrate-binding protein
MGSLRTQWSALALGVCLLLAGCGGTRSVAHRPGDAVRLLMAVAPDSLDPAVGYTAEALEADWLVYTPLLTYDHSSGVPGTQVIPGLASAPPTVSDGGRTYSLTLQPRLVYSNGEPVKASDFRWAVERAIKLGWGGAPELLTSRIVGAAAFAAGRAKTISGINTDDATGTITIQLTAPWGPFENVLALPVTAPVPSATPLRNESNHPPTGVGPYVFGRVVPGQSFSVMPNPRWHPGAIPGIPAGHVDVSVTVTGDAQSNALSVLDNTADVFDWADRIPPALMPRIQLHAAGRFSKEPLNATYLIFMNVKRKPFSSRLARIAVQTGLNDNTLKRLSGGTLQEGCFLLPPSMFGHPHDQCPRGNILKGGDVAAARALVSRSGTAGTRITVWGEANPPFSAWMTYYTAMLNQIGFKARLKLVPDASYFSTIGTLKLHPQTGFGDFSADVPHPLDFYQWITGAEIRAAGNQNWGEIDDPYVNRQARILGTVPSSDLGSVSNFWHGLERYVAGQAYLAVFGYATAPQFVSDRLDYPRLVFSPVAGLDWTSLHLR